MKCAYSVVLVVALSSLSAVALAESPPIDMSFVPPDMGTAVSDMSMPPSDMGERDAGVDPVDLGVLFDSSTPEDSGAEEDAGLPGTPPMAGDAGGGCSVASHATTSPAMLAIFALAAACIAFARRRQRS